MKRLAFLAFVLCVALVGCEIDNIDRHIDGGESAIEETGVEPVDGGESEGVISNGSPDGISGDNDASGQQGIGESPKVELNDASPSGAAVPFANQILLRFDLANDAASDIRVTGIIFSLQSNDDAILSGNYGLYSGSTQLGGTGALSDGTVTISNVNYVIPKGETRTFCLKGDTSKADANDALRVSVTSVSWSDGAEEHVTNIEVSGGTLTY